MENLFKKNRRLKTRLLILYTVFIVSLLLIITIVLGEIFKVNFNNYIQKKHEDFSEKVVNEVLNLYKTNGSATYDELYAIGLKAFDEGMIFMFNEDVDTQLICMSNVTTINSYDMLINMEKTMNSLYPHSDGEYQEDIHVVKDDDTNKIYGYVTLGYYGPIYYTPYEVVFLESINKSIYGIGILFFIFSSFIIYLMVEKITRPINLVSKLAKEISDGNYDNLIESESTTLELQNLISSINILGMKLGEQKQLKKQLAQNYTHEIRTPLTCVMTTIEGIQDGVFELTDERLESIYRDIERIYSLVDNVDKLVDTVEKDLVLNKEVFDVTKIVSTIVISFENLLRSKNIELSLVCKNEVYINADKELIQSVITNLISNAYKYTNDNGKIEVCIEDDAENVEIVITDNGIGIDKSEHELIFEHLYRVNRSRDKQIEGFGIGLALCKNVVLAHKGRISLDSKLGEGSVFKVSLPKK